MWGTAHPNSAGSLSEPEEHGASERHRHRFPPGTFTPAPGGGRRRRMLAAQTGIELRLALRHPEQSLITLFIPVVLLIGLTLTPVIALPQPRVVTVAPSILALAVLSTGFTSQAISFGFDRRYGVIARLAATALPRWLLIAGRLCAMFGVIVISWRSWARSLPSWAGDPPVRESSGRSLCSCSEEPPAVRLGCCWAGHCGPRSRLR
jgi:hypothetical protein